MVGQAHGAYLATRDGLRQHIPAYKVRAVDSTAAGDAFNGALAVGLLQGKSPVEAAMFASAVAALSVTRKGAQPSMPTAQEVSKFLKKAKVSGGPGLAASPRASGRFGLGTERIFRPRNSRSTGVPPSWLVTAKMLLSEAANCSALGDPSRKR